MTRRGRLRRRRRAIAPQSVLAFGNLLGSHACVNLGSSARGIGGRVTLRIILTRESGGPDERATDRQSVVELAAVLRAAGQQVQILTTGPTPGRGVSGGVDTRYLRDRGHSDTAADRSVFGWQTFARSA